MTHPPTSNWRVFFWVPLSDSETGVGIRFRPEGYLPSAFSESAPRANSESYAIRLTRLLPAPFHDPETSLRGQKTQSQPWPSSEKRQPIAISCQGLGNQSHPTNLFAGCSRRRAPECGHHKKSKSQSLRQRPDPDLAAAWKGRNRWPERRRRPTRSFSADALPPRPANSSWLTRAPSPTRTPQKNPAARDHCGRVQVPPSMTTSTKVMEPDSLAFKADRLCAPRCTCWCLHRLSTRWLWQIGDETSVQAQPSGRAATDEDFGEQSALDVVAGRPMIETPSSRHASPPSVENR